MNYLGNEYSSLEPVEIGVPDSDNFEIAVLTASGSRHRRFACRMQQAFGEQIVRWYEIRNSDSKSRAHRYFQKLKEYAKKAINHTVNFVQKNPRELLKIPQKVSQRAYRRMSHRKHVHRLREAREKVIEPELSNLLDEAHLDPYPVENPNSSDFVSELKSVNPTFLLTLGGPLYRPELIDVPKLAINQHAGWSPQYKGGRTVYWALYHRDLRRLGSTVHILDEGADAGPILARSFPALTGEESPEECFLRVVILGTELMIKVVRSLLKVGSVKAYSQPGHVGRTYTSADIDPNIYQEVSQDFDRGILQRLLKQVSSY